MSLFAFNIQPTKAESSAGTIYINPNGSISPSTANITTTDNITYTFTGNNYLPIIVNRSNIIINGMEYMLQTSWEFGFGAFSLSGINNMTIKNTTITSAYYGVYLDSSNNDTLSGNDVAGNNYGIALYGSSGDVLSGDNVTGNGDYGILLEFSSGNALSGNNITANGCGIWLDSSSGNVLSGNVMTSNQYNFGVLSSGLNGFMNNVSTSNLVNGKPVYYLMNQSNIVINPQRYPEGVGYLGLVSCKNVTVQGLTLTKNFQGLLLANTTNSKITDNSATADGDGIDFYYSSGNALVGNNATGNGRCDVLLWSSSANVLSSNTITANAFGIWLDSSSDNNTLSGNGITGNGYGAYLESSSGNVLVGNNLTANSFYGIYLWNSSSDTLSGNNVTGSVFGIWLASSSGNVLVGNNVTNSETGISLSSSSGNTFYHNNFINNAQQVESDGSPNTWDNGYPSGGNYWSDYQTRYPGAAENDSSAIWNTPYVIDNNNTDRYPLMGPFHTCYTEGALTGYVDIISNSTPSDFHWVILLEKPERILYFNLTSTSGTVGFCRVDIPTALTWQSGSWSVAVGSILYTNETIITSGNYTYIYFTYTQNSTQTVSIMDTSAVPEFQPLMLLPLFMIITLLGAMILKRKRNARSAQL
jgi:parallel beta-helix repeat protein